MAIDVTAVATGIDPTDPIARARQSEGASSDAILVTVARVLAPRQTGGTLLDIGCGRGNLWNVLRGRFHLYLGADELAFRVCGRLSYSIYLWQQLFLGPYDVSIGAIREFPQNLGCTLVASVLSYFLVERPFLRFKDRYFRSEGKPPNA